MFIRYKYQRFVHKCGFDTFRLTIKLQKESFG